MAILTEAAAPPLTSELTYEAYMAEPEVQGRYDIINGVRQFMAGASYQHQRVANNVSRAFYAYEQESGLGTTISAPFDVLIQRTPKLQTRQPDVLFISFARLLKVGGRPAKGPLPIAPENAADFGRQADGLSQHRRRRMLGGAARHADRGGAAADGREGRKRGDL